jgi:hypothetical protein
LEIEAELRVASDRILQTLDQLEMLETEKRTLKPDSDRFQHLAREIERLAAEIFAQSHKQQTLGEQAQVTTERTGEQLPSINNTTTPRELHMILAEWRDAERRMQLAEPDSAEHAVAQSDSARLREEYHAAYSAGTTHPDNESAN